MHSIRGNIKCHPCGKEGLTVAGYHRHATQSRNLQCLAHYEQVSNAQLAGHIPTETAPEYCPSTGYANSINENMDSADEIDEGGQVLHFEGDFFGHYTEEDFEWPDDHGVVEGDKDADESSDEEVVFDGEIGWEPAVLNAPDVGEQDSEQESLADQYHQEARAHHQNTRDAAEARLGHASPYITHFPLPTAGAPVSGPSEMPHEHIYEGYSQKIAGSENIYAPFESKLDFDIALWAKMRGSGSTAFTDLLAIDNVGH
jgi:hypothetical protein